MMPLRGAVHTTMHRSIPINMYIDISQYHSNMHQNDGLKSQGITLNAWRAILNPVDAHGVQSACNFTFSDTVSANHSVYRVLTNQDSGGLCPQAS